MSLTGAWKRAIRVANEQRSHMAVMRERSRLAGGRSQNHAGPSATRIDLDRMTGAAVTPGEPPPASATRVTAGCPVSMTVTIQPLSGVVWQESDQVIRK